VIGGSDHQRYAGSRTHCVDFSTHKLELMSGVMGDGSVIDRHDCLPPGEGCHAWVPFGLLAFGESPRCHEVLHHGALFDLVFDGVCMVQTSCFEKFLEVLIRLPCLALGHTPRQSRSLLYHHCCSWQQLRPIGGAAFAPFCCLWRLS
jgi:hypothetical protein